MSLLASIDQPDDLRALRASELVTLAAEIRELLIEKISRTGGHLGPNLGTVELTIALHRVFSSPRDAIIWDTGHQAYVHKILTGRRGGFERLRKAGGLSGYPSRAESPHDLVENSHASTALSYADGLANAFRLTGVTDRGVVAVVGDGALTGGMAWEALNNIAAAKDRPLVIVVNDNGRSYAPTIGGLANHLATLRMTRGYERFLELAKSRLRQTPVVGEPLYDVLHGAKKGLKDVIAPQGLFEDLGLKYVGPMDGHDIAAVESALRRAQGFGGPVIVHCITRKGLGYKPAERNQIDHCHAVGAIDRETGRPLRQARPSWTSVFADELAEIGARRPDVVAITAAMLEPTGLTKLQSLFPERVLDVGIAEQHAVTSAAGLAMGGMHPVVAIYSTFLNRAFDQLVMDVALHRCGVTLVLDRAGVTGEDGPSHNGIWDLSILQAVPGLRICAPRDPATLRTGLREAVTVADAPTVVRFPKGEAGPDLPAVATVGGVDVLRQGGDDALIVAIGAMAATCLEAADLLAGQGIGATVVDPRWVKPVDPAIAPLGARHRLVATVEDSGRVGGAGATTAQALRDAAVATPVACFGIPQRFLEQGTRAEVLAACGLTAADVARGIAARLARSEPVAGNAASRRPEAAHSSERRSPQ
jgi:1-deoxy-D-xylulose-5-phosphate synthase